MGCHVSPSPARRPPPPLPGADRTTRPPARFFVPADRLRPGLAARAIKRDESIPGEAHSRSSSSSAQLPGLCPGLWRTRRRPAQFITWSSPPWQSTAHLSRWRASRRARCTRTDHRSSDNLAVAASGQSSNRSLVALVQQRIIDGLSPLFGVVPKNDGAEKLLAPTLQLWSATDAVSGRASITPTGRRSGGPAFSSRRSNIVGHVDDAR
jgi:hypothetical protein